MTTENWINVAMIIAVIITAAATLVGPVLAAYVQVRMSQPKPTPEENQLIIQTESRVSRFVGRWMRSLAFAISLWIACIFLIVGFIQLPISRLTITSLVLAVTSPTLHGLAVAIGRLTNITSKLAAMAYVTHKTVHDGIRMFADDILPPESST